MPTAVTLRLKAGQPLLFDETWPLEDLFCGLLQQTAPAVAARLRRADDLKPFTLSPIRRAEGKRRPDAPGAPALTYQWRVCLLDDALTPLFLQALETTPALTLDGQTLAISGVAIEEGAYAELARQARAGGPDEERRIALEFLTPAVLQRAGLPMPLPDPPLLFQHYLAAWDTFAPRELRINFNLLDAIAFHVGVTGHRLETRRIRLAGGGTRVGVLGSVELTVMDWRKLGGEFLGQLQRLAQYAGFCGTGELTAQGLGQTRYLPTKAFP